MEESILSLPDSVAVTPAVAMAAFEFVRSEVRCTEMNHVLFDAVLCLIADRAGFGEFTEAFKDMPKWYA